MSVGAVSFSHGTAHYGRNFSMKWLKSGHGRLGRQMTLLMVLCDFFGNCIKDAVSAPRPNSSLVRRLTATSDEEQHAMEYGIPYSHALNTVCLTGYFLHYGLILNSLIIHMMMRNLMCHVLKQEEADLTHMQNIFEIFQKFMIGLQTINYKQI